ncbi:hypothetical protein CCHL11_01928 [Colletotrichum chlorophyti]|uniref:Uncharacterized protein n=1 Tax=Colletotrichum chlorophyti TaxID=708187 RepID=A0A1Q8RWE6_9PEZI|nr:hypothetical protein CCHL11_01928 [Colletotrichum chlorophyti]
MPLAERSIMGNGYGSGNGIRGGSSGGGGGNRRFDPDYGLNYGHSSYAAEHNDHRRANTARLSLSALDANEVRRGAYAHVFLDVKNSNKSEAL